MCLASGGLLGIGPGRGWMKYVFAADSDVVFATIAEEWGLIMALLPILCILVLGIFSMRSSAVGRSSFYTIGGCTAAGILLVQSPALQSENACRVTVRFYEDDHGGMFLRAAVPGEQFDVELPNFFFWSKRLNDLSHVYTALQTYDMTCR